MNTAGDGRENSTEKRRGVLAENGKKWDGEEISIHQNIWAAVESEQKKGKAN